MEPRSHAWRRKPSSRWKAWRRPLISRARTLSSHRWTSDYKRELVTTRVQSTRSLVATLLALQHPPPVLLVASAVGYYGDRGDALSDERSSRGDGFLADLCQEWEQALPVPPPMPASALCICASESSLAKREARSRRCSALSPWLAGGPSWVRAPMGQLDQPDRPRRSHSACLTKPNTVGAGEPDGAQSGDECRTGARALSRAVHRPAILPAPAFALRLAMGEMADAALLSGTRVHPAKLVEAGFAIRASQHRRRNRRHTPAIAGLKSLRKEQTRKPQHVCLHAAASLLICNDSERRRAKRSSGIARPKNLFFSEHWKPYLGLPSCGARCVRWMLCCCDS